KIRTARAVDIIRSAVVQHTASHVVGKSVGVSRRLGRPAVAAWVVLKGISELDIIDVPAAHDIKLPISREKHSNRARVGAGQIRTWCPTAKGRCSGRCGRW